MTTPITTEEMGRRVLQLENSTWIDSRLALRALEELAVLREVNGLLRNAQAHHLQQIEALKHRLGLKGPVMANCLTCGTGSRWWFTSRSTSSPFETTYKCLTCEGDPLVGNGRADWKDYSRAKMVKHFGPRIDGDVELLRRYEQAGEV